jgi:hypothetical protein
MFFCLERSQDFFVASSILIDGIKSVFCGDDEANGQ